MAAEMQPRPVVIKNIFTAELYEIDEARKECIQGLMKEMESEVERRDEEKEDQPRLVHPNRRNVVISEEALCLLDPDWEPVQHDGQIRLKGWLNDDVCV